jgi:hypothetical protein
MKELKELQRDRSKRKTLSMVQPLLMRLLTLPDRVPPSLARKFSGITNEIQRLPVCGHGLHN